MNHTVIAEDIAGAIKEAQRLAYESAAAHDAAPNPDDYINTFVFSGDPEILSTWAG